jgi:transcription initiation factor TFIIIB Brf1 subunit/transcription initiation factor TFIIB
LITDKDIEDALEETLRIRRTHGLSSDECKMAFRAYKRLVYKKIIQDRKIEDRTKSKSLPE